MVKSGLIPDVHNLHLNKSSNSCSSGSSSSSSTPRHFFIPILSDASSTTFQPFCIPKAFLKYLQVGNKKSNKTQSDKKGEEVLEAILRSNGRGKSFHVNMIMDKDGRLMSEHEQVKKEGGWKDFSDYHELHLGDILLFRHLGSLSFDVTVFDSTTCQRKYPPLDPSAFFFSHMNTGKSSKTITTPGQAKRAATATSAGISNDDDTPSNQFTTHLKPYTFSAWMMRLPVKFVRANDLGNKNCIIIFRDERKISWPIGLRCKKFTREVYIYRGLRQFIEGNGLKEGDVCTFELISQQGTKNIVFDIHTGSKTTTPDQAKQAVADKNTQEAKQAVAGKNTPSNKFTTSLKPHNFSKWRMTIPVNFA